MGSFNETVDSVSQQQQQCPHLTAIPKLSRCYNMKIVQMKESTRAVIPSLDTVVMVQ